MVGGKTGTAEKILGNGYDKKANLAFFVATFPVHDPRYVLAVMVDEPKGQKNPMAMPRAAGSPRPP